ncbi:hypothetical protein ULF88_15220 [Halopseudomonas pachastrellae]|nr:hypothetical protein [Halopseudomonas pachastrellae]
MEIDRDAAARLGLNVTDVANTLYNAFGQRQIATPVYPGQPVPRDHGGGPAVCRHTGQPAQSARYQR